MTKRIEILILVVVLVVLAFVFGCEEEPVYYYDSSGGWPESDLGNLVKKIYEKNGLEYNEDYRFASWTALLCPKCGQGNSYLAAIDKTTYCPYCRYPMGMDWDIIDLSNSFTIEHLELPGGYTGEVKLVLTEPNEPTEYCTIADTIYDTDWEYTTCSDCGTRIHITKAHRCLSQFIPTWPDYIELEKNLIILYPKYIVEAGVWLTDANGVRLYEYQPKDVIPKGTKIYFKE